MDICRNNDNIPILCNKNIYKKEEDITSFFGGNMAKLYYRYGAMNCGKTTHLLQVAHNYEEQKMKVLIMKPSIDTKGGKRIVSRLGISKEVDHLISKDEHLYKYIIYIFHFHLKHISLN